jgi:hypothetical protein
MVNGNPPRADYGSNHVSLLERGFQLLVSGFQLS